MGRAPFIEGHLIDARLSSTESLLHSNREHLSPNLTIDKTSHSRNVSADDRTYSSMMKLFAESIERFGDKRSLLECSNDSVDDNVQLWDAPHSQKDT